MNQIKTPPAHESIQWRELDWGRTLRVIGPREGTELASPPLRLVTVPGANVVEIKQSEITIGRHSEANLQLHLPEVSRFHCRLFLHDGCWTVEDLGSTNGTLVNGEHIHRTTLRQNDVIRIAEFLFQVDFGTADGNSGQDEDTNLQRSSYILHSIAALLPEEQAAITPTAGEKLD
jgi:pSer/pThr/pTyr-binding forkhead associated (FHA) protein